MESIRVFVLTAVGIALAAFAFIFAASLGLVLAAIAAVLVIGSSIAARLSPRPIRATVNAKRGPCRNRREPRVWNDGRGTIIDL